MNWGELMRGHKFCETQRQNLEKFCALQPDNYDNQSLENSMDSFGKLRKEPSLGSFGEINQAMSEASVDSFDATARACSQASSKSCGSSLNSCGNSPSDSSLLPGSSLDQDQWPDDQGYYPMRVLEERNIANLQEGKPPIHLKYGKYDPKELDGIKARALQYFEEGTLVLGEWLQKTQTVEERENLVQLQSMYFKDKAWIDKQNADGGKWITEYLADVGYDLSENPYMMKMIVMTLFPPIIEPGSKGQFTVDNMRPSLRKLLRNQQFIVERAKQFDRFDDTSFLKALS